MGSVPIEFIFLGLLSYFKENGEAWEESEEICQEESSVGAEEKAEAQVYVQKESC